MAPRPWRVNDTTRNSLEKSSNNNTWHPATYIPRTLSSTKSCKISTTIHTQGISVLTFSLFGVDIGIRSPTSLRLNQTTVYTEPQSLFSGVSAGVLFVQVRLASEQSYVGSRNCRCWYTKHIPEASNKQLFAFIMVSEGTGTSEILFSPYARLLLPHRVVPR